MPDLRIVIADDHPLMRRGVRQLLAARQSWQVVGEACTGFEAVEMSVALKPDIVVLDVSMPGMNGLEAAALIAFQAPQTGVVFLTMHDPSQFGSWRQTPRKSPVVLKSDADRTLLAAVESTAGIGHALSPPACSAHTDGPASRRQPAGPLRSGPCLTGREREIMRLLAKGSTSKEAAINLKISTRTVESHRSNMSRKLGLHSTADLVRYAIFHGVISHP